MDDAAFLKVLRAEPDNEEVRAAYLDWLDETGDARAPFVRLMRQRAQLLEELEETDRLLRAHQQRVESAWIDIAFPMRVRSPMEGSCYLKPAPGAPPFVLVGSRVAPETVVCLIESMCLLSEVTAGVHGVVAEVAVTNESPVDHHQVLFRIHRMLPDGP